MIFGEHDSHSDVMKIQVLYFAILRTQTGKNQEIIEVSEKSSVKEIYQKIKEKYPTLSALEYIATALNDEYVTPQSILKEGDTVCLIPPVCGG